MSEKLRFSTSVASKPWSLPRCSVGVLGRRRSMPVVQSVIVILENVQLRITPSLYQPMRMPAEWLVMLQLVTVTFSQGVSLPSGAE